MPLLGGPSVAATAVGGAYHAAGAAPATPSGDGADPRTQGRAPGADGLPGLSTA